MTKDRNQSVWERLAKMTTEKRKELLSPSPFSKCTKEEVKRIYGPFEGGGKKCKIVVRRSVKSNSNDENTLLTITEEVRL